MKLRQNIEREYKSSIKLKNKDAINTLRLIKSAIKDKDIANRTSGSLLEINDQQILSLLQNLVKQRKDSIESFKVGSRNDLIARENKKIEIINQFLPKQLNIEETKKILNKFIADNNITSIKDMGKIMVYLKTKHSGSIDMGLAGKLAKELLVN